MDMIAQELQKARTSLLDLTLRNRLLNYRVSKVRSIRIVDEAPAEVYDSLVLREKALQIRGTGPKLRSAVEPNDEIYHIRSDAALWQVDENLKPHQVDRYLQTPYDNESLSRKLFHVYHEGRSVVDEQGYTVVHLALAFLEWFESDDSGEPRRAPLILIPAELERVGVGDFSRLRWTGEDVVANVSLGAKMSELGVVIPPFEPPEEKNGIDIWFRAVVDTIQQKARWRVLSEMVLDFFSFTKFVMHKDLDPAGWPAEKKPYDHPLLRTLFEPVAGAAEDRGFDEREIDTRLSAGDLIHVMDADPSQIAVTQDVRAGRNLVVQGPPGTGKSQTITNLIGEALAAGKTVLFVSEKMAALEVVKSRLDVAGLGPFCLELHSRKSNKKAVLNELQHSLSSTPLTVREEDFLAGHDQLKTELNRLAFELGAPVGRLPFSPYELYGLREEAAEHFDQADRRLPLLPAISEPDEVTVGDLASAREALRDLSLRLPGVQPIRSNTWRHSSRDAMQPHHERELTQILKHAQDTIGVLRRATGTLSFRTGVIEVVALADVSRALTAAAVLSEVPHPVERELLLGDQWNALSEGAEELLRKVGMLKQKHRELAVTFRSEALDWECDERLEEFRPLARQFFRLFNSRYRVLRSQIAALYARGVPSTRQMVTDLERLAEMQNERALLRQDWRGRNFFGAAWNAEKSDVKELRRLADWLVAFRRETLSSALSVVSADWVAHIANAADISAAANALKEAARAAHEALARLFESTGVDATKEFGVDFPSVTFPRLEEGISVWNSRTSELYRWAQFNSARNAVSRTIAAPIGTLVMDGTLEGGDVLPAFHAAIADSLLRIAFNTRSSLSGFMGDVHDRKIAKFRELDRGLATLNRARLSKVLHDRRPRLGGGASRNSEAGILLGEFSRRRGHMPIRKLLSSAGGLVQRIKPCFLMSPLSVAQFLDPRIARFDLIVFDEASQVRPEDALGALLRGQQLVVMGDTHQLPPTTFFDHLVEAQEEDEDQDAPQSAGIADVESILHQSARSYPTKSLNWHYRSRHESLIAISNYHFYDNALRIYPSAIDHADEIGLHFRHIPTSVYDRGKTSRNVIEANAVAAAAFDHYRRFPTRSLGVGTFNIKQQEAILEEVELQLERHPELEPLFKRDRTEPFFVKNLETIQGDERDVILISVGYGRDASGRLSVNFGPVNREGGERRLNVLISRAREKCVVFSNFTFRDLPNTDGVSKGVAALRSFLEYAETRHLVSDAASSDDSKSVFIDAIGNVLSSSGYEIRRQVGCAGFRVDLGVVDPDYSGRYLVGIECDGPKYHHSLVARDRDRLREEMLHKLGWRIHRMWSTDWYRNREEAIRRLVEVVEELRRAPREEILVQAAAEVSFGDLGPAVVISQSDRGTLSPEGPLVDVAEYQVCRSLRISTIGELHLVATNQLATAVEVIVGVEGPVHIDEVVRRLRTLWGLGRAGSRIRTAIERAARLSAKKRAISFDGEFLRLLNAPVVVRRRNVDPPPRIDLICEDEIAQAIKLVLEAQFATARPDLITAVARVFGIQSTSDAAAQRISSVVDHGLTAAPPLWSADETGMIRVLAQP